MGKSKVLPSIEIHNRGFELDLKRCYLPFTVHAQCPQCKEMVEADLSDSYYLSYPKVGKPIEFGLYCETCEKDIKVLLVLKISLEIAPEK